MSAPVEVLATLPLELVDESTANPRKHFDGAYLKELAEDLLANGQIQPVRVRPRGERYELVVGACRLRALKLAGLPTVQAIVREYTDLEVPVVQLAENAKRSGIHALEEADAYVALRDVHQLPVEEIEAKVGYPLSRVKSRLELARLCAEGREAFFADKITGGVAQLVARLDVEQQVAAVKEFTGPRNSWQSAQYTVSEAQRWIRSNLHLALFNATFDLEDATLVPAAGACKGCPKNTSTQPELFDDHSASGSCTDRTCYAAKAEASWQRKTTEQRAAGAKVLSVTESAAVVQNANASGSRGFVALGDKPADFGGKKTWGQLLKKAPPPTVVVQGYDGRAVEMVRTEDLKAAKKAAGLKAPPKEVTSPKGPGLSREEVQAKFERSRDLVVRELSRAAQGYRVEADDRAWWQAFARVLLEVAQDGEDDVAKLRKLGHQANALREEIEVNAPPGVRALIVELLAFCLFNVSNEVFALEGLEPLAKVFKVDLKALEKRVDDELRAEREAAKTAKKAAAKGPPAKGQGTKAKAAKTGAKAPKKGGSR